MTVKEYSEYSGIKNLSTIYKQIDTNRLKSEVIYGKIVIIIEE